MSGPWSIVDGLWLESCYDYTLCLKIHCSNKHYSAVGLWTIDYRLLYLTNKLIHPALEILKLTGSITIAPMIIHVT